MGGSGQGRVREMKRKEEREREGAAVDEVKVSGKKEEKRWFGSVHMNMPLHCHAKARPGI